MTFQRVSGNNQLPTPTQLEARGTSEGVKKAWESRKRAAMKKAKKTGVDQIIRHSNGEYYQVSPGGKASKIYGAPKSWGKMSPTGRKRK